MLATNAQVNASVLLVNLTVATQKTGLSGITEIDVRMVGNVYDSIFATESDAVNIYLTPMFTGMFNTSVLNITYRMDAVVTPIRALLQKVRDTAYSIKRNNLVRIAARIDFFSKDITAFLNGIATTTLNKFNARTIVISKVANCQKTVFTAFNATLAQAAANMTTVARSFMTSSQSAYSSIQNYYMGVSNIFDSVVLNIPSCLDSNSIVNAWAMDWVTDAQRIGYIACIDPVRFLNLND